MKDCSEKLHALMWEIAGDEVEYLMVVHGSKGTFESAYASAEDMPILLAALLAQIANQLRMTTPELVEIMKPYIERWNNIHQKKRGKLN